MRASAVVCNIQSGLGFVAGEIEQAASQESVLFSFHGVIIKCVVQLELDEAVAMVVLQQTLHGDKPSHGEVEGERNPEVCPLPLTPMHVASSTAPTHPSHTLAERHVQPAQRRAAAVARGCARVVVRLRPQVQREHAVAHVALEGWYVWPFGLVYSNMPNIAYAVRTGFMRQLPNLLKQETTALHACLSMLFRMYEDDARQHSWPDVESRLFRLRYAKRANAARGYGCLTCVLAPGLQRSATATVQRAGNGEAA